MVCNCKKALYCDVACQNEDRIMHEEVCSFLHSINTETFSLPKPNKNSRKGLAGLSNQGNTCYMNSANQCLSNVPHLREFLFSPQMLAEINVKNVLGSKGVLALRLTQLLGRLWLASEDTVSSLEFKKALGESNSMYLGSQ